MLIDSSERDIVIEAFRRGACGVISRTNYLKTLCECIRAVHQGQIWVRAEELHFLVEAIAESTAPRILNAKGPPVEQTRTRSRSTRGRRFDKPRDRPAAESKRNTVRNYVFRIFDKVGTSNRVELALYAVHQKL